MFQFSYKGREAIISGIRYQYSGPGQRFIRDFVMTHDNTVIVLNLMAFRKKIPQFDKFYRVQRILTNFPRIIAFPC